MTDQPFPVNQPAIIVDHVIDGVFKVAVQAAETALVAANPPIFGNPILEKIDNEVIEIVANLVYKQFALWVTFEVINVEVGVEVSDEKKALVALKEAQKSGDKNAQALALEAFRKSVVGVTHIDGAAQPGHM